MAGRVTGGGDGDEPRSERRREAQVSRPARPRMADLTGRAASAQRAVAEAEVGMSQETLSLLIDGRITRGDVLSVSELAGVMAAKRTSELIPLGHPVSLTDLVVQASPDRGIPGIRIRVEAATVAVTGVEMEALTAAAVAALTVYDMVREVEREAVIRSLRLVAASSETAGEWQRRSDEARVVPRAARAAGRIVHAPRDGRRPAPRGRPG